MVRIDDVKQLRYWCHKVLPLVYDDSLSYYEVLCKVTAKLNEMVEIINGLDEQINQAIMEYTAEYVAQFLDTWEVPLASETKNGGIRASAKTSGYTAEVKIDTETGKLYVVPYTLPIAGENLGGVKGEAKTSSDTVPVHIDSTGEMYVPDMTTPAYTLPVASTTLGGVKGNAKTSSDTIPVHIDSTGEMYVPDMSGSGNEGINVADIMTSESVDFDTALDSAISRSEEYGTIIIPEGDYTSSASHVVNKAVKFVGDGIADTVITIDAGGTYDSNGWLKYNKYLNMKGIYIKDARSAGQGVLMVDGTISTTYDEVETVRIEECKIESTSTNSNVPATQCFLTKLDGWQIFLINSVFIGNVSYGIVTQFSGCRVVKCVGCTFDSNTGDTTNGGLALIKFYQMINNSNDGAIYNRVDFIGCTFKYKRAGVYCDYTHGAVVKFFRCSFDIYDGSYDEQAITYDSGSVARKPSALYLYNNVFSNGSPNLYGSVYASIGLIVAVGNTFVSGVSSLYVSNTNTKLLASCNANFKADGIYPNSTTDISIDGTAGNAVNTSNNAGTVTGSQRRGLDGLAYLHLKFNMGSNTSATITLNDGWKPRYDGYFPIMNSDRGEIIGSASVMSNNATITLTLPSAVSSTYGMRCTLVYPTC